MLNNKIKKFIKQTSGLNVLLIGETIIDRFIKAEYEGYSMKSSCPVFRITNDDAVSQQGGTSAIAGHLKNFVKNVDVITNTNEEIVKTRYINTFDGKKHVEINKFDTKNFKPIKANTKKYDLVIIADFGHGFCDKLDVNGKFHLMCQTNSNNFGFNRMSKWKEFQKKSICIDLREASLQMNKSISGTEKEIKELYNYEMNTDDLFVTIGAKGSIYTNGKKIVKHKSYPSNIVDTIGAGDTYFAFACLLSAVENNINDLSIPSLAASLSTTWLCNEKSVTKEGILEYSKKFKE